MQTSAIEHNDRITAWPVIDRSEWPTKVPRFPRLFEDEIRRLVTETRELMKDLSPAKVVHHKQQIAVGDSLVALRRALRLAHKLKHGEWQGFYKKTFAGSPVSLRSAQKYMRLAREAGEKRTRSFLIGTDDEIDNAVEQHKKAVEAALLATPQPTWLSIRLPFSDQAERNDMHQFWKSSKQLLGHQTVDLWRQLLRKSRRAA
jgi:hypothetical protein